MPNLKTPARKAAQEAVVPAVYAARYAKEHFGEVLDAVLRAPVGVSRHGRLVAYCISREDLQSLLDAAGTTSPQVARLAEQLKAIAAAAPRG